MELPKIGDWTEGDLRRYVINLLLAEPGTASLDKPQKLPASKDGDVPVWDAATNSWLPSSVHKIPAAALAGSIPQALLTLTQYLFNQVVVFSSGVTYTPAVGTRAVYVECIGGGGAGGGTAVTGVGQSSAGAGGGSGAYAAAWVTANLASACTIAIGGGGAGAGGAGGGNGGDTSFKDTTATVKALAKGGTGGGAGGAAAAFPVQSGIPGAGGLASGGTGSINADGGPGYGGQCLSATNLRSGAGGASALGGGGIEKINANAVGGVGGFPGGGGSGASALASAGGGAGGAGGGGLIRIWEFF